MNELIALFGALLLAAIAVFFDRKVRKRPAEPKPDPKPEPTTFNDEEHDANRADAADTDADPDPDAAVDAVVRDILSE